MFSSSLVEGPHEDGKAERRCSLKDEQSGRGSSALRTGLPATGAVPLSLIAALWFFDCSKSAPGQVAGEVTVMIPQFPPDNSASPGAGASCCPGPAS